MGDATLLGLNLVQFALDALSHFGDAVEHHLFFGMAQRGGHQLADTDNGQHQYQQDEQHQKQGVAGLDGAQRGMGSSLRSVIIDAALLELRRAIGLERRALGTMVQSEWATVTLPVFATARSPLELTLLASGARFHLSESRALRGVEVIIGASENTVLARLFRMRSLPSPVKNDVRSCPTNSSSPPSPCR